MSLPQQGSSEEPSKANFQVCVRIRPLNSKEEQQTSRKFQNIVKAQDQMVFVYDPNENSIKDIIAYNQSSVIPTPTGGNNNVLYKKPDKEFLFDQVFDENCSTDELFQRSILSTVDHIMSGYNSTVFAYGMTSAGKSFTIFGNLYSQANGEEGLALLIIAALHQKSKQSSNHVKFTFSYLEIYNENIRDLMVPKSENLMVIEDAEKGVFVPDLTEYPLENPSDIKNFILQGNTRRIMASTAANQFSSRSHAIIQILCEQTNHGDNQKIFSKLCIVDLAGSERAANTENRGMRLTEGANINRSLLALGNCINLLSDSNKKGSFVPYRDSKLTRLLKESLGGNTKSTMIACISGSSLCYEETVNTLKYAVRARKIKKSVKKNAYEMTQHVSEYKNIITGLRDEIISLKSQLSVKSEENQLLRNKQRILHNYNSNNSVDISEDSRGQSSVDEIGQSLFENLEENWDITNAIEEIISLNTISENFIREQERMVREQFSLLRGDAIEEIQQEIGKRQEVIESNHEILDEMNIKLKRNIEQKKELQMKIKNIGTQIFSCTATLSQMDTETNGDMKDQVMKDMCILEMQKKMQKMQEELKQKDKLLLQKQKIIKDLTVKENTGGSSGQQKKSSSSNQHSITSLAQPLLQNTRRFYMKIPKEMISERTNLQNQSSYILSTESCTSICSNQVSGKQNTFKRQYSINSNTSQIDENTSLVKKIRDTSKTTHQTSVAMKEPTKRPSTIKNSQLPSSRHPISQNFQQVYPPPSSSSYLGTTQQGIPQGTASQVFKRDRQASVKYQVPQQIQQSPLDPQGLSNWSSSNQKKGQSGKDHKAGSGKNMEISISDLKQYAQKLKTVDFNNFGRQLPTNEENLQPTDTIENFQIVEPQFKLQGDTPSVNRLQSRNLEMSPAQPNVTDEIVNVQLILSELNKRVEERVAAQYMSAKNAIDESTMPSKSEVQTVAQFTTGCLPIMKPAEEEEVGSHQGYIDEESNEERFKQPQVIERISRQEKIDIKNKGVRSLSCFKPCGGQEYELNSYALARKRVREFKDKLTRVSENVAKYSREEIVNILKEYKTQICYQPKTSDDEQKVRILEMYLVQHNGNSQNHTHNVQLNHHSLSQHPQQSMENVTQQYICNKKSGKFSQHSSSNVSSYVQQQQQRMQKREQVSSSASSQSQFLKNISNNFNQLPPQNVSIVGNSCSSSASNKHKKVLPRGMLSQINSNYAETVTYSKKASSSINSTSLSTNTSNNPSFLQQANRPV